MIQIENPYIVYSLPSSRVYQPMVSRKLQMAWKDIQHFLSEVTTANFAGPESIQIEISSYRNSSDPDDPILMSVPDLMEDPGLMYLLNNGIPQQRTGVWEINAEHLNAAIAYFEKIQPGLKNSYDIKLYLHYPFKLVNPLNHDILELQQLTSMFSVYFSRTHVCLPTLFFPFPEANEYFWNYLDAIKPYLPFVIDEKHLRLSRIKNRQLTSFKKIVRSSV